MKSSPLIYTLLLVAIDAFLLLQQSIAASSLLLIFSGVAAIAGVGLLFSINSFLIKSLVSISAGIAGVVLCGTEINSPLIVMALFFHAACLWCEIEKYMRSDVWGAHYKASHKMRHNWLSGLSFIGGLLVAYTLLSEYDYYSPFYSLGLLSLCVVANLVYMEGNRLHNLNVFWVEVSPELSGSGSYWRSLVLAMGVFIFLGINYAEIASENALSIKEYFRKNEVSKKNDEDIGPGRKISASGFNPGEVTLNSKVDIQLVEKDEFYVRIPDPKQKKRFRGKPLYMGAQELVKFNGRSWLPMSNDTVWYNDEDDGKKDGLTKVGFRRKGIVKQTVFLLKKEMSAIFALPGLHTVRLNEVYMSSLGVLGIRPGAMEEQRKYSVYSSYYSYDEIKMDRVLMLGYPADEYLALPKTKSIERIGKLTKSIVKSGMSQVEKMEAIKSYLGKNCKYSLKVNNKNNYDPVLNFLFAEKKGHCLLFASAYTIMLRQAGIPSRLVNGYAGGSYDRKNNLYIMKSSNAHAWTEVYFSRYGWVVVDPTPEATNIQPEEDQITGFEEDEYKSLNVKDDVQLKNKSNLPFFLADTDSAILTICFLLVVLSYSWQFLRKIPLFKGERKPKVKQRFTSRPEFILVFENFCQAMGITKSKSKTAKEMLAELKAKEVQVKDLDEMINYYYSTRFAGVSRKEDQEVSWIKLLKLKLKQAQKDS
ncbi:MAG: transglutaminase-like domain-containing protein [Lentisphaeraceae bacterium]|nr:transglutaminase-like domain-containing protein [Lentisphaeraceae bacterium]